MYIPTYIRRKEGMLRPANVRLYFFSKSAVDYCSAYLALVSSCLAIPMCEVDPLLCLGYVIIVASRIIP